MTDIIEREENTLHPYTYQPAKAVRYKDENGKLYIRWFDLETNEELPPYFGMGGKEVQEKVDNWYKARKETI